MIVKRNSDPAEKSKAEVYLRVLYALILRDMRTRFGGSHMGYAVAVLWPVVHVVVIVAIMTFRGLPAQMLGGTALFVATGAVPCLIFQYISREVMKGYAANKPLTYYPQVKIFDVIGSRVIVEVVSGFMGAAIVMAALALFGINVLPADPFSAFAAYFAAIFLGISIGIINISIVVFIPAWQMGFVFVSILNYMLAGVVFMPSYLPDTIYYYFKFNPVVQIIEWMRKSYDPGLAIEIDYLYIFLWIFITMSLGFLLERFVARKEA